MSGRVCLPYSPPHRHPPRPPCGVGCGVGKPCASANLMHALHHMDPALHQNATFACTAVPQNPTKLLKTGPNVRFPLISLRKPSNLLAWPCTPPGDPATSGGGGAILDSGAYIYNYKMVFVPDKILRQNLAQLELGGLKSFREVKLSNDVSGDGDGAAGA